MKREKEILEAAQDYASYVVSPKPSDVIHFENGAEWADKNPNPKTIAEYLYKEKGYPISLNGDIPTYEEVVKHIQAYNNHKIGQKACDGIESTDVKPNLKSLWHDASKEPLLEDKEIKTKLPNKIYLRELELQDPLTGERMISIGEPFGKCSIEYVNLDRIWHDTSEEPLLEEKEIIFIDKKNQSFISVKFGNTFPYMLEDFDWENFVKLVQISKWAYVSDLSPKAVRDE